MNVEQTMELDDFRNAWQTLDRRLRQQNELGLQLLRHQRLDAMRRGLRPLVAGQAASMLIGALAMIWLLPMWTVPAAAHDPWVKFCGAVLHAYCIGLIVLGGVMQGLIARVDYAAPVLTIQQRLLKLRRTYLVGGMLLGLPWWFLSAPLLVVLTRGAILDTAPSVIGIQLAVGAAGLLATGLFHRWAHRPQRAEFGRRLDAGAAGGSLRRAQAALDELARFERE